ncbi:four helix bundle protein [Scytonema millei]|uniref:Four helix bundle protein n=1 Tax=Scytonema millei VB511283 TaxID=1245923 RepID=A0A9X5E6I3_9CYAN|nr:four helix bundle protein [Scytonema millei]NHC35826.1 four helix bundle protein [Scytonema millei VB511283]
MTPPVDICDRAFQFAVRRVKLCSFLNKKSGGAREISKQLIRSGTSVGANVEESRAAQSTADFVHKLEIALKEARETRYWLKLIIATAIVPERRLLSLLNEVNELMNIIAAIIIKSKANRKKPF